MFHQVHYRYVPRNETRHHRAKYGKHQNRANIPEKVLLFQTVAGVENYWREDQIEENFRIKRGLCTQYYKKKFNTENMAS